MQCLENLDDLHAMDPDPDTPAELHAAEQAALVIGARCTALYGEYLEHLTTADAARDLDLLRSALGDDKINYLGFSYGTKLGAVYARLFPEHIRTMVLDGAVSPGLDAKQTSLGQARGFERAFDHFVSSCNVDVACPAYPDAAAVFERLRARVEQAPIAVATPGETRQLTVGYFQLGIGSALYNQTLWPMLARGLADADRGDGSTLLDLADHYTGRRADGTYPTDEDARIAIVCADSIERGAGMATMAALAEFRAVAPRLGSWFALDGVRCAGWPLAATAPVPIAAPSAPAMLVIGTTGDPATPVEWATQLADGLGSASLITVEGEGHTSYLQSACVTDLVDAYLLRTTVPAEGTSCAAPTTAESHYFTALQQGLVLALQRGGMSPAIAACAVPRLLAVVPLADYLEPDPNKASAGYSADAQAIVASCRS